MTLEGQSRSHRFSVAYISKFIQDNHRVTIDDEYELMRFHMAPLSLTWSDLERSHRVQAYFKGRNLETHADTAKFIMVNI